MLVERSREFWSLVDQTSLLIDKFYDVELILNQGWFGRVSRLQCFGEITQHALMRKGD